MSRLPSSESSFAKTLLLLFFLASSTFGSSTTPNENLITIEQSQTPSSEYNSSSSSSFPVELVSTPVNTGIFLGQSVPSGSVDGKEVDFEEKQHFHTLDEQGMFVLFCSCFHSS